VIGQPKAEPAVEMKETPPEVERLLDTPVEIAQVREQIKRLVGHQAPQMVRTMIAGVEKGNYLAMKYLFEMVGIYPATIPAEPESQDSFAKILFRNLGIEDESNPEAASSQTKVTEDSLSTANDATGHAVE
jgi:hypothetical protein